MDGRTWFRLGYGLQGGLIVTNEEKKQFAYVVGMLIKVSQGISLTGNEIQSLENIADDLGFHKLPENEFRW